MSWRSSTWSSDVNSGPRGGRVESHRAGRDIALTPIPPRGCPGGGVDQSHFGRPENAQSTTLPPGCARPAISVISCSLSSKSKIAAFSDSRSTLLVRGMTTMSCCTRKRRQTCAAVFLCAAPMRREHRRCRAHRRARSGYRRPPPCRGARQAAITFDWSRNGWHSIWLHTSGSLDDRQRLLDQRHGEVRHADMARQPVALDLAQRADGVRQRDLRIGPVQQQQVDLAQPQPHQAIARRALELARGEMARPDFGGDEHVVALDARGAQAFADLALVVVHLRGVDVAIAEPQRLLDDAGAGAAAQFPGAEPEQRNPRAIGLDARYGCARGHASAIPLRRLRRADDARVRPRRACRSRPSRRRSA